ncbi:hypothetical protein BACPEC_01906 [[Bacteroides] pectinophilus ATCC 43243]|uniref:Uncharacterized protein n=1 Tax=[Bacteroides] pectinophilus ATCC 43243 TaxID=483218 RepID=B7AS51_9FIRM|nr:hypothetical protein BACPEC_01906 [[Bacteroides] pectinophilus ATCC 43243]
MQGKSRMKKQTVIQMTDLTMIYLPMTKQERLTARLKAAPTMRI